MRYIFESLEKANEYNSQCTIAHGHNGTTEFWDAAIKHPTLEKWSVTKSKVVESDAELINELPSDWFTEIQ